MTTRFQIEAERFALPQHGGSEVVLDDLGLLATAGTTGSPEAGLVTGRRSGGRKSFCLVGEPSAGKTTALRSIVQDIPSLDDAEEGQGAVLWVSMGEAADSGIFREQIAVPVLNRVPKAGADHSGGLAVVLDGLDESPHTRRGESSRGTAEGTSPWHECVVAACACRLPVSRVPQCCS